MIALNDHKTAREEYLKMFLGPYMNKVDKDSWQHVAWAASKIQGSDISERDADLDTLISDHEVGLGGNASDYWSAGKLSRKIDSLKGNKKHILDLAEDLSGRIYRARLHLIEVGFIQYSVVSDEDAFYAMTSKEPEAEPKGIGNIFDFMRKKG